MATEDGPMLWTIEQHRCIESSEETNVTNGATQPLTFKVCNAPTSIDGWPHRHQCCLVWGQRVGPSMVTAASAVDGRFLIERDVATRFSLW